MKKYQKPSLNELQLELLDIVLQSQITLEDNQDILEGPFENI